MPDFADFEAISFDCYGTLVDWESGLASVLSPWARSHGLGLDDDALLTAYGAHEAHEEAAHPRARYPDIVGRSFTALGRELGAEVTEEDARLLGASVPDWPVFPDSSAALAALAGRFKLIILSNVDRASFAGSARKLGVDFDAVITAQDIGCYKPSRRNFDALLAQARRMGIARGKLLHAAQSLFHDHGPAKAAGLPTVWINRRSGRGGWGATPQPRAAVVPDWEFSSMAEFAAAATAPPAEAD
jgi:2-haloacid dehalogenase